MNKLSGSMIAASIYKKRREELLSRMKPDGIAIIPGAREQHRNGDTHYPFRQNSHFFYLSGFNEPDALLVIKKEATILFNQQRNPEEEQWTGKRLGQEEAPEVLLIDKALPIESLETELPKLLSQGGSLYYTIGQELDKIIFSTIKQLKSLIRR